MQIWVGASGYSYPDWVGAFYSPGTPPGRMLQEYARSFPLVELNFTYYRVPTAGALASLAKGTPEGFQFLVKLHGAFTHESDLSLVRAFRAALGPLAEKGKLMGLLAQFPQRFHEGAAGRRWLERLAGHFAGYPLAVEFRHRSWDRPEVYDWLRAHGLHIVSVDVPAIAVLFPTRLVQTSRLIYVRFHSRRAESWYAGEKERYDYLYSDEELREWLDRIAQAAEGADRALLLFNNCRGAQAVANARRIAELLRTIQAGWVVMPPFAAARPSQRTLF